MALVDVLSLLVMTLFGVATAAVLAFMLRDVIARLAAREVPDGGDPEVTPEASADADAAAARAQRVAMAGPVVFLAGFLLVLADALLSVGTVAGLALVDVGVAVVVLAAAPMAAGFYIAWRHS